MCAHADATSPISSYAPISAAQIEAYDFSYAALGHIHNPPEVKSDKTLINYCGFLFGRSFDELGEGGAYLVTVDKSGTDATRIVFSERKIIKATLDVSGAPANGEISQRIAAYVKEKGYSAETSLFLSLIGTLPFELTLNRKLLEGGDHGLSLLKIKDMTTPMPDGEHLAGDVSLRGEIYRTLLPKLESTDADERKHASEALRLALLAIDGANIANLLQTEEGER